MADKPILFSRPMSRAILEGRKTQTRRVINSFSRSCGLILRGEITEFGASDTAGYDWYYRDKAGLRSDIYHETLLLVLPYETGDRVWVREEHYRYGHWEPVCGVRTKGGKQKWQFIPDSEDYCFDAPSEYRKGRHHKDPYTPAWHKRLARFMPRKLSRTTLIINAVKVELLQKISREDAIAEGASFRPSCHGWMGRETGWSMDWERVGKYSPVMLRNLTEKDISLPSARMAFAGYWDTINGPNAWHENPFVAAYSFTAHRCNIDKMGV